MVTWTIVLSAALASVTSIVALTGGAGAIARYAFLVPIVAGAARFGFGGGLVTAVAAVLLYALFVLPSIERQGFDRAAAEGLVTFVILLLGGTLTGALTTRASRERQRYDAVLAIQRALADEDDLEAALLRVSDVLRALFAAHEVALTIRDGDRCVAGGSASIARHPATGSTLQDGTPRFVSDVGGESRPRRLVAVPVAAGREAIGVVAVTRYADFAPGERTALLTLGACIGLALENARLVRRQRRFAEELADKIARATERLAETDRAKSMFVATASHELRTPLTAVRGFSELLAHRRFPPAEVRRLASLIQHESERLVRLVDDLLDLSRLERGLAPPLRREPVDVRTVVESVLDTFSAAGAPHRFVVDCAPGVPAADVDPDALDRIVKNLVSNAIKYSPPGAIRIAVSAGDDVLMIEITDRGRGIPMEALPHVFDPYFRAPGAAATTRGAGIGLAVVKALVDAHGGAIVVESAPESGTRVRFTLPVSRVGDPAPTDAIPVWHHSWDAGSDPKFPSAASRVDRPLSP